MSRMGNRVVELMERGEYLLGRSDWNAGRYQPMLQGDAKAAYELGRQDAQTDAMQSQEKH